MKKETAILIACALFPHYPSVAEFHITSDEQPFFNAVDASNHAKSLELKDVTVVTREEYEASLKPAEKLTKEQLIEKANLKITSAKVGITKYEDALNGAKSDKAKEKIAGQIQSLKTKLADAEKELSEAEAITE